MALRDLRRWMAAALVGGVGLATGAFAEPAAPTAPEAFGVAGRETLLAVHAVGAQVYVCKGDPADGNSWAFREPIATLVRDGETVGRHFAGPSWQLSGGETVTGKVLASAPGRDAADIPLLKLEVVDHRNGDMLKDVSLVLRLATRGGVLKGPCGVPGELRAEPYSADYVFLK
jgi:hypothetical protein